MNFHGLADFHCIRGFLRPLLHFYSQGKELPFEPEEDYRGNQMIAEKLLRL